MGTTKLKGKNLRIKFGTKKFLGCTSCDIDSTFDELDASTKDGRDTLLGDEVVSISGNGVILVESSTTTDADYEELESLFYAKADVTAQWISDETTPSITGRECVGKITSLKRSGEMNGMATASFTFKGYNSTAVQ